jgi:hypothetical protein
MKKEWRKHEKQYYLPKQKPEIVEIPEMKFFTIEGEGNPNEPFFAEYIGVLYSLSYAVKMSPKKGMQPDGYFDYTVYPLEGVWDLKDVAKKQYTGNFDKKDLIFKLMIRQPEFVTEEYAKKTLEEVKKSKPHKLLDEVKFESIAEGKCVQMLHVGPYDDEPASFAQMEQFAIENGLERKSMKHREIYLTDARKTPPEKLKTVLRFTI